MSDAFAKVLSGALEAGASSFARIGGAALGQTLFGSGSSNRSSGANIQIASPSANNVTEILKDSDLDKFSKAGLSQSGFVKGIPDYRAVGASNAQAQAASIADRGLERMIQSLISTPPVTPDVAASMAATMVSARSVSSNSKTRRFQNIIKQRMA
tara:strand:+ start:1760 stop:2224 length:465 start_codon:yes stop_codon:yes gene_type:complete